MRLSPLFLACRGVPGGNPAVAAILVIHILMVSAFSAACVSGTPDHSPAVPESPGPAPAILITSPEFDGGIPAGNVTVTVLVRNFTLTGPGSGENIAGTGHLVCFLDAVPPVAPDLPALTRPGSFQISSEPRCVWQNVSPGTHTFAAELVNRDNTPLIPPVLDAVDVTAVPPGLLS